MPLICAATGPGILVGSPDVELTLVRQDLHEQLGNTVKAGVDVTRSLVKAKLGVVKTVADVVRDK